MFYWHFLNNQLQRFWFGKKFNHQTLLKSFAFACRRNWKLLAWVALLTEKSPFKMDFHVIFIVMFVVEIGIDFSSNLLLQNVNERINIALFEDITKSLIFALWSMRCPVLCLVFKLGRNLPISHIKILYFSRFLLPR